MMRGSKVSKTILILIGIFFVILLLIDRYYWAQVAPWREDEATNLWLGYTHGIGHIPVGLISTSFIPNPNGMIVLGFLLSILPNLLSISFFLGCLQIVPLFLIGSRFVRSNWHYSLLAAVPSLTSVILRAASVELWNQYTITFVNVFFLFWALRYLEKPSPWNLPPIAALILVAPSLYLAGVVNAIVMAMIALGLILYKRPIPNNLWPVTAVIVLMILASVLVTWFPYFQQVSLDQIRNYSQVIPESYVSSQPVWKSILDFPVYVPFRWANSAMFPFAMKQANDHILSESAKLSLWLVGRAYLLQTVFALAVFLLLIYHVWRRRSPRGNARLTKNTAALQLVLLSALFISLSYIITLLLHGPDWIHGKRPDQTTQFLPMFLFLVFLAPIASIHEGRIQKVIHGLSVASLLIFAFVNLLCGFLILRDNLQYHGRRLSEADVPLIDKQHVVDFIAADWKIHSGSIIVPVDYNLGGEIWDWVPEFGEQLAKWYPAPMTMGRSFDYELLRRYGLTNAQEGIQRRTFRDGRYLVTYSFEKPPKVEDGQITHHVFGRLRVSVVEK